jgi:uncharacterized protein YkwD
LVSALAFGCAPPAPRPVARPNAPVGPDAARDYLLSIVNRDRAAEGLSPVLIDETANRAGQAHAEDMARFGYTAHWGTDGSVPEQRYTEAGGEHLVFENAACFFDGNQRELEADPSFSADSLDRIQKAFMDEVPPNDGHRRNILNPRHTHVGFGVARPVGIDQPCLTHEFVDQYGDYSELPKTARRGHQLEISGEVKAPATFGGIGIAHDPLPKRMSPAELNQTSSYKMPTPYATYFPPGFVTPKPVKLDGKQFSLDLAFPRGPGRYSVSIWGRFPGSGDELTMTSLRTVLVK